MVRWEGGMMTGWQGASMGNRPFPQRNHPFRPGNEGERQEL